MTTSEYSVGPPQVLYGFQLGNIETVNLFKYRGLFYIKILPPTDIKIGILPLRTEKYGLVFPLCRVCGMKCQQSHCEHSEEERALIGVWSHVEVHTALSEGYKLLEVTNFIILYNFILLCNLSIGLRNLSFSPKIKYGLQELH
jgi:hypothetical protein